MTLLQIDDALNAWNSRLAAIAENLLDLKQDSTYQVLTGAAGSPKVKIAGATAARVEPALRAMLGMFEHFGLLHATIDRARKLRAGLPTLFGAAQKLAEIEHLLFARSIQLSAIDIPLEQRTLLTAERNVECLSPEELLQAMAQAFATARDAVLAVSRAWEDLATGIDRAEAQLRRFQEQAPFGKPSGPVPLQEIAQRLQEVREQVQTDPLGALAGLNTQVLPLLAQESRLLESAEQLRRSLAQARRQWTELDVLHRAALAAAAESQAKIADRASLPPPSSAESLSKLREWLDRLDARRSEGLLDAANAGLRNWQTAADEYAERERHACAAHRAAVEARGELRGRLDALKAKARAYGVAEQAPVAELALQAETLLYTRPTALDRAGAAVTLYETRLRQARSEAASGGLEPR